MTAVGFLGAPEPTTEAERRFDEDRAAMGYVMNVSRLWAHQPTALTGLYDVLRDIVSRHALSMRDRGILVAACASSFGDSYCALAWGSKLAAAAGARTASGVLCGDDEGLSPRERAMAAWARKVAGGPHQTTAADLQPLRDAGFSDAQIFGITAFVGFRVAFSTVNSALGVGPDAAFRHTAPEPVRAAVTFGRPIDQPDTPTSAEDA
jgi:uncharacterized peroxidase-related enzyme